MIDQGNFATTLLTEQYYYKASSQLCQGIACFSDCLKVGKTGVNSKRARKEIASIAAVPLGTVMSRLARARKRLQHYLTQHMSKEL